MMLWLPIAYRTRRAELLRDHVLMHVAVWDPKRLNELLGPGKEVLTQDRIREIISRAEAAGERRWREVGIDELTRR